MKCEEKSAGRRRTKRWMILERRKKGWGEKKKTRGREAVSVCVGDVCTNSDLISLYSDHMHFSPDTSLIRADV